MSLKQTVQQQARVVNATLSRIYTLEANVILGSPSSGCKGLGICKIIPMSFNSQFPCTTYPTEMTCLHSEKRIVFKFNINNIDDQTWSNHFCNNQFCIVETFNVPLKVCSAFGVKSMCIVPGNYAIWQYGAFLQFVVDWEF